MTQVVVGENEGIESALRRFKRQVSKAGIFADMKRLRHFETPIEKKKRKAVAKTAQAADELISALVFPHAATQ
jgi:small subunit ribosomal protein S21